MRQLSFLFKLNEEQREDEFLALMAAAATACSATGRLQSLTVKISNHPTALPTSWVAVLTSLRRLVINGDGVIGDVGSTMAYVCGSLDHLTNLQELILGETWAMISLRAGH